jgi:cytidylate kinase
MENQKIIIAINREFGSGGREIACKLGELLGLKVYDRAIFDRLTTEFNLSVKEIERIKAKKISWWKDFCRFYQQYGTGGMTSGSILEDREITSRQIYLAESKIMQELAEQESCIFVGRSGFHVFKNNPNAIKIFLIANDDARLKRIMQKYNLDEKEAKKCIEEVDKSRETYTQTFAGVSRYDARNYDFVLNVSNIPPDHVAQFLADNIRKKYPSL